MFSGINNQVNGAIDINAILGGEGLHVLDSDFRPKDLTNGKSKNVSIMDQHNVDREYTQSRMLVEAIRKLKL